MKLPDRLRAIVDPLPPGCSVTLPADAVRAWLDDDVVDGTPSLAVQDAPATWRERIWTVPPDTRMGVLELAEACARSRDWVYRATNAKLAAEKGRAPLPCSRLDGELQFRAGDVRAWIERSEVVVNVPPPVLRRAG